MNLSEPFVRRPVATTLLTLAVVIAGAMAFANRVAAIAEEQGHHPDLHIAWGRCGVEIWTHKIDGLTESDFFLAAKADRAFRA